MSSKPDGEWDQTAEDMMPKADILCSVLRAQWKEEN